jgi:hypothetical protein
MATQEHNTAKPFDGLADLADCYEALGLLAMDEEGHGSPTWTLLHNLNRQLRAFVDQADEAGLLT